MTYRNPILRGDYSDPDVIRVGDSYYMVSSSFSYLPGIPVLTSRDLIHWKTIGYAASALPFARYDRPAHKCGTWAPSIRWHNGLFYVYVCLPDEGLIAFTAKDPAGRWLCHYVHDVCGWIDPCPMWDEDGRAYLLHGFAASRCGINNVLYLHEMSADGFRILDKGKRVYDGEEHGDTTVEGPKLYRRGAYYYILCPAGGVKDGYQLALRAASPYGPYKRRVVLAQGKTSINGPHQGGLVDTGRGQEYFIHFQDIGVYGRIPHLQPVIWQDGWPCMGDNGQPVLEAAMPDTGFLGNGNPDMSDDFKGKLSIQWQWQANPNPSWYELTDQGLRLYAYPSDSLFHAGQFLSQLMQHINFDMDISLTLHGVENDRAGIGMMGYRYGYLALEKDRIALYDGVASEINRRERERVTETALHAIPWSEDTVHMRLSVRSGRYAFSYGVCADNLSQIGDWMAMTCGGWISARPGIFCLNTHGPGGYAEVAYCKVTNKDGE